MKEQKWIIGWGSAQQEYSPADMPSTPLSGAVIREILRMSIGGDYMRLELSNQYGQSDLVLSSVHVAKPIDGGVIDALTDTLITFGGKEGVTIPAGMKVKSDKIMFRTDDLEKVALTIQASDVPKKVTGHSGARTTTYIKSSGTTQDVSMNGAETNEHWYFASSVEVLKNADYSAIACLGDSITDGRGTTTDADNRWTNVLEELLRKDVKNNRISVINQGIGGNSINTWGLGDRGRWRYERDVLKLSGISAMILLEGINDIGEKTEDNGITDGVIEAYREIITKAHKQGIDVYGGTILPCGGHSYYNPVMEQMRCKLNNWIRTSGEFDAVIDFDAVMRDEDDIAKLKLEYDSGDGLHPGPMGYVKMGKLVYETLFK